MIYKKWLLLICCLILIVNIAHAENQYPSIASVLANPSYTNIHLVVIDMHVCGKVTAKTLMDSDDAILIARLPTLATNETQKFDLSHFAFIPSIETLRNMDSNHDGMISMLDPEMKDIYLLTLSNQGKKYTITSMYTAGVRALIFQYKKVQTTVDCNLSNFVEAVNHTVMADSSHRIMVEIEVDKDVFSNLNNGIK